MSASSKVLDKSCPDGHGHGSLNQRTLVALGIVFGDIGTSPLYAFQVALGATGSKTPSEATVLGIASLIIWSLIVTIFIKYNRIVLRADNEGQGGILALIGLVKPNSWATGAGLGALGLLGIIGAAFIFGDGTITPAMSVLSAMEGLKVLPAFTVFGHEYTPHLDMLVLPLTVIILVGLFCAQKGGTDRIGKLFGPVMVVWFASIFLLGAAQILHHPSVLQALNPVTAGSMLWNNPVCAMAIFGAVFLALTGGEAMYADMGHVGAPAIRRAFSWIVLPALCVNYLGQAAAVIADPTTLDNPFYKSGPDSLRFAMIIIATLATIIASQALITGSFSLTRQAIQMSLLPRMKIIQTSLGEIGQIYIPVVNYLLMVTTIIIVLSFRSSDALASAYGIAVSGTMLITTVLLYRVMVDRWNWKPVLALSVVSFFGLIDLGFFVSNTLKVMEGGWLPLAIGGLLTWIMVAFRSGQWAVRRELNERATPVDEFIAHVDDSDVLRIKGKTGVFMTKVADGVTPFMQHYIESTGSLPEHVVLCTVETTMVPFVIRDPRRVEYVDNLGHGFSRLIVRHGFMQAPRIEGALGVALPHKEVHELHFFVGHETVTRKAAGSRIWYPNYLIFSVLKKCAASMTDFFHLKDKKVMKIGMNAAI